MFRNPARSDPACWLSVVLATVLLAGLLHAQDEAPARSSDESSAPSASKVLDISDQCAVEVRDSRGKHAFVLASVLVPEDSGARAQLREFLARLLTAEEVVVREIPDDNDKQPHQAYLLRTPDKLFVNLEVVRQGYAKAILDRESEHYDLLRKYQQRAKKAEKGVWAPQQPPAAKAAPAEPTDTADNKSAIIVYVTKSGKKYHRKTCHHLRKSSRAITLAEALEKGYTPCRSCKPPPVTEP